MTYNKMHGIMNEAPTQEPISPSPSLIQTPDPIQPAKQIKVENMAQPQVETPQPVPSIKKSKPIQSGSNKNIIIGAIAATVVLIGILVAVFSGGSGDEEQVVVEVVPRVNYDSIAQVRIQEALIIKEGADTIIQNHPDEYTDASIYNNVEDIYKKALVRLDDALADKDSLDANVASTALQQQETIKAALLAIYKNLDAGAEYVQEFRTRADAIKPLIEDLLENQSNETIDEEND
jgi:hypothetical protein